MICPQCIEEMNLQTRKEPKHIFGHFAGYEKRVFYVCKCGYNILKRTQEYEERQELKEFVQKIKDNNNKNLNYE